MPVEFPNRILVLAANFTCIHTYTHCKQDRANKKQDYGTKRQV
jgi:hypothetical protein